MMHHAPGRQGAPARGGLYARARGRASGPGPTGACSHRVPPITPMVRAPLRLALRGGSRWTHQEERALSSGVAKPLLACCASRRTAGAPSATQQGAWKAVAAAALAAVRNLCDLAGRERQAHCLAPPSPRAPCGQAGDAAVGAAARAAGCARRSPPTAFGTAAHPYGGLLPTASHTVAWLAQVVPPNGTAGSTCWCNTAKGVQAWGASRPHATPRHATTARLAACCVPSRPS